jgi:hypothetical protein
MVDEGQRSCGHILETVLVTHSWTKPLTSAKGKEVNPPSRQTGARGSAAHENEANPHTHDANRDEAINQI